MTEAQFWTLIDRCRPNGPPDYDQQLQNTQRALGALAAKEIESFDEMFNQKRIEAYRWDLWGAACLINGGCSDDGFEYFCRWLISRGQNTFDAALSNPDSLASLPDLNDEVPEFEEFGYVADKSYENKTASRMPDRVINFPKQPTGDNWDFDDAAEMERRFPNLSRLFGNE